MAFKQINTSDQNLQFLQDNFKSALPTQTTSIAVSTDGNGIQTAAYSFLPFLFSGGSLVSIALTSGVDNLVPHGLNKIPTVWVLMGQNTNATVWSPATALLKNGSGILQSSNDTYINLRASAGCTVSVWIA